MVDIRVEQSGAAVVLAPIGRVDSSTAKAFEERMLGAAKSADPRIVVDCAGLDYISSAGLRVVLMGAKTAKASGGKLVLCNMSGDIRRIFDLSGFATIMAIVPGRDEAVAAVLG